MADKNKLLYQLIAASDPVFAANLCKKYGYTVPPVRNARELGDLLRQLVVIEGEPAFIDIMDHHPHKDLILEMYAGDEDQKSNMVGADGSKSGCGCGGAKNQASSGCGCNKKCSCQEKHLNASGPDMAVATQVAHNINNQTGVIVLSCAVIIALAIMSKK